MEIVIVEDMESDFSALQDAITDEMTLQKVEFRIRWFPAGELFLASLASGPCDLLFLDVLLGDCMNGMDTARAARRAGFCGPIVFTTSEREYAVEGFEVQAVDYLVKPYYPERVHAVLRRILAALRARQYLTVQLGRTQRRVCLDDLMWAEAQGHSLLLHLQSGETLCAYRSFEALAAELPPQARFQCCCRGVIVNLEFVQGLQNGDFLLTDGQRVPISRPKRTEMQKALSAYAVERVRGEMTP
ncbi:MAG: LytTR family DNA-binding domain-containing protein [Faecalibacterium sp.]|jgi:DNA-binding LytR/AlgR family response regulator|nr:LytTR family DNA-binding domain-containing protein [Faecalibacterium sp.]